MQKNIVLEERYSGNVHHCWRGSWKANYPKTIDPRSDPLFEIAARYLTIKILLAEEFPHATIIAEQMVWSSDGRMVFEF